MISVDEYRATVTDLLGTRKPAEFPLADCAGLVLANDVRAGVSLPPFDNSAMDGYAVRATDVAGATGATPVELPVAEDIPAGRTEVPPLRPGTAHRIMTGAPMPSGADSVVMVEHTDAGVERVRIFTAAQPGAHIRRTGEDVVGGTVALSAGSVLGPAQLGLAAAVGLDQLPVHAPPKVLVVSTGTELVLPPRQLRHGQIYESNSVMLAAGLRALGCEVELVRSVADDVDTFRATLEPKLDGADLVVTSGGVSAGAYEVVKDALADAEVHFQKVAMQPGGPQGCGSWLGVPFVTLPGNPVSVLVSFEAFLRPALLSMLGHTGTDRQHVRARLTEALRSPSGKRQFRRGYYTQSQGQVTGVVGPRGGPGSHLLAAFTQANCLIVLPEEVTEVAADSEVDVLLL
ncbi:molybdopterin molybdenumtransferase [Prauserella marina]|uniref:Molybdopterin molybdenumtransferase n=1 Tax=Prauserella marina TaxID=530584 RepID=A0A222VWF9_9PSEU|nr:gephyrin-like molybdotransferase Glp [Prauserella marina]ASR38247.1 molybdopterin molybdenumtransferase [Prauserella marina]PWV78561.1 molybdopterin molybdochelatase [Prauserella marina]SDC88798.1 molybdopterin molybdotransferase [Prauserella marina]